MTVSSPDPDKVIFIFLGHVLNATEKPLPNKEGNFVIPSQNINYADYMLPFELLLQGCRFFISFLIWIKSLSKVGSEILLFHQTRSPTTLLRRTWLK